MQLHDGILTWQKRSSPSSRADVSGCSNCIPANAHNHKRLICAQTLGIYLKSTPWGADQII